MRIEIEDAQKTYKQGLRALDQINLRLESPGMIGLVGPNGAGKTTLMRLLVGQMPPTAGRIRVDGVDLQRQGKAFRRRLGYLPQGFGLYEELTVRQFLDYMACLKGLPSPRREAVQACIKRAALTEKADARIRTLSGGQKQRVGIAQALLNDPELLIVDEPTVGLDPEERIRFRNLFSRDAGRRLVILSTHIIEDVESICNRLIVLHQGQIRFDGAPCELVRRTQGHVGVVDGDGDRDRVIDRRFRITGCAVPPGRLESVTQNGDSRTWRFATTGPGLTHTSASARWHPKAVMGMPAPMCYDDATTPASAGDPDNPNQGDNTWRQRRSPVVDSSRERWHGAQPWPWADRHSQGQPPGSGVGRMCS